jgi:hypothetical protein
MNELDVVLAHANINVAVGKLRFSVDEIKEKNPQRSDLINSMEETISTLIFSIEVFRALEKEYRIARQRASDMNLYVMQQDKLLSLIHI